MGSHLTSAGARVDWA